MKSDSTGYDPHEVVISLHGVVIDHSGYMEYERVQLMADIEETSSNGSGLTLVGE